jgi:hypothetical protein
MMKRRDVMEEQIIIAGTGAFCVGSIAGWEEFYFFVPGIRYQPQDGVQVAWALQSPRI